MRRPAGRVYLVAGTCGQWEENATMKEIISAERVSTGG